MASSAWEARIRGVRRVAFDTNALIYLFEAREPYAEMVAAVLRRLETGDCVGVISTVVEMELLVRPFREQDLAFVDRLSLFLRHERNLIVRSVDSLVARTAAALRARSRLGAPDALIAATAAVEGCDAIIGNDADFARRSTEVSYLRLDSYTR